MKKIILPLLLICTVSFTYGQKLKNAQKFYNSNKIAEAKTEIDAVLEKEPDNGDAIYLKSKIYNKIADSAALHNLYNGDARAVAFQAYQKAVADSADMKLKLQLMQDQYQPVFDMYTGYYQAAIDDFNKAIQSQDKNDFANAMNHFIQADEVGQYIRKNEWATIGEVDTTLVLNIGKAAINAKDDQTAINYFSKIAEAKIAGPAGSNDEGFKLPYEWLENHYRNANDEANMLKYAKLGNEVFPKESYFNLVLLDYYRHNQDRLKMFDVYDDIIKENPDSVRYRFSYANDIFGYLYGQSSGTTIPDRDKWMGKLKTELDAALAINPNDINSNWLTSQYFYNMGIENRDEGLKTSDADKKSQLREKAMNYWKEAIPFAEKAVTALQEERKDKSRYQSVVNLLQNIYQSMGDQDNLKKYEDLYDNADVLFSK